MLYTCSGIESDPLIRSQLEERLKGTSLHKTVSWVTIRKEFVDAGKCTNDVLVATMNSILMPFGIVSGKDNCFWNGLQFDSETGH
jgi:hypothetical protein